MISKGNELLQELYDRLTGRWYNTGKYAGQKFNCDDVKAFIKEIYKEYEEDGCTNI